MILSPKEGGGRSCGKQELWTGSQRNWTNSQLAIGSRNLGNHSTVWVSGSPSPEWGTTLPPPLGQGPGPWDYGLVFFTSLVPPRFPAQAPHLSGSSHRGQVCVHHLGETTVGLPGEGRAQCVPCCLTASCWLHHMAPPKESVEPSLKMGDKMRNLRKHSIGEIV